MSSSPVPEQSACRHTVVYLVHGTWPRGIFAHFFPWLSCLRRTPCWYEEGSNFWNQLAAQNIECRAFKWSGNNSVVARRRAASMLRQILHRARKEEPDVCHLVIAHSHGGNVSVRALGHFRSNHPLIDGIATIGTPFFHIYKRNTQLASLYYGQTIFFVIAVLALSSLAIRWATGGDVASFVVERKSLGFALIVEFVIVILLAILNVVWLRQRYRIVKRMPTSPCHSPTMLILRAPGDEASIALAIVQFTHILLEVPWRLTLLLQRVLTRYGPWPQWLSSIALWFVFMCLALFLMSDKALIQFLFNPWEPYDREGQFSSLVSVWRTALYTILPLGILHFLVRFLIGALSVAGGLLLAPFGWELLFCGLSLEVNAEATPPGRSYPAETVNLSQSENNAVSLRHKLYELPSVQQKLAQWIEEQRRRPRSEGS